MRKPKTPILTRKSESYATINKPVINLTGGAIEREIVSLYDRRNDLIFQIWEIEDQIEKKYRKLAHIGPNDSRIRVTRTKEGRLEIPSFDDSRVVATEYLLEARVNIDREERRWVK